MNIANAEPTFDQNECNIQIFLNILDNKGVS